VNLERWQTFSLGVQLGHIGGELGRARLAKARNDTSSAQHNLDRALALLDLTLADVRWNKRSHELGILREVVQDQYNQTNLYEVDLPELEQYCNQIVIGSATS